MTHPCVLSLEENEKDSYLDTSSVLIKVVDNILKSPSDSKYRSLRLANPTVMSKIIPAIGAMECLFEMGFKEGEDRLILPQNAPLQKLKVIRDEIFKRREVVLSKPANSSQKKENPENKCQGNQKKENPERKCQGETSSQQKPVNKTSSSQQNRSRPRHQSSFINSLWMRTECVMQYEDQALQEEALKILPVADIKANAERKMRDIQKIMKKDDKQLPQDLDIGELMLIELMSWFKNSFFTWVDSPECPGCKGKTVSSHTENDDGIRVEVYICNKCRTNVKFPRYNDVGKLLQTRRGRCGEWANCFTFLCIVLGWDARFVFDETDHVWTEVYSHASKRWIHCDPCENVIDKPLMYELGWNKKLSYVIAFSPDEIQDVTWRYTTKTKECLSRRKACSEGELIDSLVQIRESLQSKCSEPRKKYLQKRMLSELVEFLTPQVPNKEGYGGRTSGSMAWRLARGETNEDAATVTPFVWTPTCAEISAGEAHVFYSAARDCYTRGNSSSDDTVPHWHKGVFQCESVFRKEEKDWKMVYLARKEGSSLGKISWKFDCGSKEVCVGKIEISFSTALYESGKVNVTLCNETSCQMIPGDGKVFQTDEFDGSKSFTLTAELSGGKGDTAWQHAQLFRQEMSDVDSYPLKISVKLRPS